MAQTPGVLRQRSLVASALVLAVLTVATGCGGDQPSSPAGAATPEPSVAFAGPDSPTLGLHALFLAESVETASEQGPAEHFFGYLGVPRTESNEALVDKFVNRDCDVVVPPSADMAVACDTEGEMIYMLYPALVTAEQIAAVEAVRPRGGYPGAPDVLMLTLTDEGEELLTAIPGTDEHFPDGFNQIAAVVDGVVIADPVVTERDDSALVLVMEARPPWHPAAMVRAFGDGVAE